nr:unnamed protein product [Callosobruchus chinensis]
MQQLQHLKHRLLQQPHLLTKMTTTMMTMIPTASHHLGLQERKVLHLTTSSSPFTSVAAELVASMASVLTML